MKIEDKSENYAETEFFAENDNFGIDFCLKIIEFQRIYSKLYIFLSSMFARKTEVRTVDRRTAHT